MKVFGAAFNRAMSGRRKKRPENDDRPFGNPEMGSKEMLDQQQQQGYHPHPYFYSSGSLSSSNYYKLYSGPPQSNASQSNMAISPPLGNPYVTHSSQVPDYGGVGTRGRRGSYSSNNRHSHQSDKVPPGGSQLHQRSRSSSGRFRPQQQQHTVGYSLNLKPFMTNVNYCRDIWV